MICSGTSTFHFGSNLVPYRSRDNLWGETNTSERLRVAVESTPEDLHLPRNVVLRKYTGVTQVGVDPDVSGLTPLDQGKEFRTGKHTDSRPTVYVRVPTFDNSKSRSLFPLHEVRPFVDRHPYPHLTRSLTSFPTFVKIPPVYRYIGSNGPGSLGDVYTGVDRDETSIGPWEG